jgi:hypothetical protein
VVRRASPSDGRRCGRPGTVGLVALLAVGAVLATSAAAVGAARTSGPEEFDSGLIVSGASGSRNVVGSVVAARGVFTGVGRIVERPNRPGESDQISRDDLVFSAGTIHIVNLNRHVSLSINRRTCKASFKAVQRTTVEGGTGRFANATGTFAGTVTASAVTRRKANGTCDQDHPSLAEVDSFSATGTLTF